MKKYLFGVLAIALAVGFSAFTTTKAHKPVDMKTYFFTSAAKYIPVGEDNSLVESGIDGVKTQGRWSLTDPLSNPGTVFATGNFLAAITFDEDQLDLVDALNGLWTTYTTPDPDNLSGSDGMTFSVTKNGNPYTVTIRKKTTD